MKSKAPVALLIFGINARRVGGIEVHTREVVKRLGERGWQVVLCFHQEPSPEVREYLSLPNVTWDVLPDAAKICWQTSWVLIRLLRQYRPRLLHLQFTPFLNLWPWIARFHGVRSVIFTDHGSHPEGYAANPAPALKRKVANILTLPITHAVGVSQFNCNAMSTIGYIPATRVKVIYNGADLTRAKERTESGEEFRRKHGIPLDRIVVTQVSWIIPEKGIPDVLDAAQAAVKQEPTLHFVFVGDGKYLDEYKRRVDEMGLSGHVTWTGLVRDPMGEGVFAATDISCQASRWEEAFGLVIAEAMAFKRPLVVTRVGGIPEIVLDGETGFVVARRDVKALAETFVLLARDRALRERLGQAGRLRAEAEFDVRKNVAKLLELYSLN